MPAVGLAMLGAIALITVGAWLPSLGPYVPIHEDYGWAHVSQPSLAAYRDWALFHLQQVGLWRVIGLLLTDIFRNFHPLGYPLLAIALHLSNGVMLAYLLTQLGANRFFVMTAALYFVVLPSAFEANMYAVASQSILTTTVFLALAGYLSRMPPGELPGRLGLAACFLSALVGNAMQENLLFSYLLLPVVIAHAQKPISTWGRSDRQAVLAHSLAMLLAIAIYVSVTTSVPAVPIRGLILNPETLISFPAYQYSNFWPFQVWSHLEVLQLAGQSSTMLIAASMVLLIAGLVLARGFLDADAAMVGRDAMVGERRILESFLVLWYSAGLIYSLAGGYSLESRKKYVTMACLAVVLAFVTSRLLQATRSFQFRRRITAMSVAVILFSAGTTWIMARLWVLEAKRGAALMSVIEAHPEINRVRVTSRPDIARDWPNWKVLASPLHHDPEVTEFEAFERSKRLIKVVTTPDATLIECQFVDGPAADCELKPPLE